MNYPENSTLLHFKGNITDAVLHHARKLFGPMIGVYLIQFVLTMALVIPLFLFMLPAELSTTMKEAILSGRNIQPEEIESMVSDPDMILAWLPKLIAGFSLIMLAAIFINAVVYNIAFKISQGIIEQGLANTANALRKGLDKGFLRLIGLSLVLILLFMALSFFGALFAGISPFLFLLYLIPMLLVLLRFSLAFPCVTSGEMKVMEALHYSWNTLSWKRAFKLILSGVVLLVVLIVFALFAELLKQIFPAGGVQVIFTFLIQIVLGIAITAVIVAALNGLFYRYGTFEVEGPEQADEHLVL